MNFDWLYQEVSGSISEHFYVWCYTVLITGAIGLVLGIVLVAILRSKKAFQRPHSLWTLVAKLNYLYMPICFATLFGLFGAIYGIQNRVYSLVDFSTNSISALGTEMLPLIDTMAPNLNSFDDLKDAINRVVYEEHSDDYYKYLMVSFIINHYTQMMLNELGYPSTVEGVRQMVQENNFEAPGEDLIQRLPNAAKSYYGIFFTRTYIDAFLALLPYLLIPIAEFTLFWLVSFLNKRTR